MPGSLGPAASPAGVTLSRVLVPSLILFAVVSLVACNSGGAAGRSAAQPVPTRSARPPASTASSTSAPITTTTTSPTRVTPLPGQPLAGKVIGIDPGHNGLNYTNPSFLAQQVFNGRTMEDCDTTGTATASGYTEPQFNFNVAQYLATDLEQEGAKVVLTRQNNSGLGPCVDQRAEILNQAGAAVAIDIHADGGPPAGRGFSILEPVADGPNNGVITASEAFGSELRSDFLTTGMPISTYDGTDGVAYRTDLAGLNLTTVPKVLIECGNMKNVPDASLLTSAVFQQNAATAMATAITTFVTTGT